MDDAVKLQARLRASIERDIDARTNEHQAQVEALKIGQENLKALGAPSAVEPLHILAQGDSWFDYPLVGNGPLLGHTDVIAQLKHMGKVRPMILNLAHFGEATTDELGLPKQRRMIKALRDSRNWSAKGKPDAILFSGGGNDIAGDTFCIFLDYNAPGSTGLDPQRFKDVLSMIEGSYSDLFAFRDRYAPGVPIFGHDYDLAIPNGVAPICSGPWLQPSLTYCGWTEAAVTRRIVRDALEAFRDLLRRLSGDKANDFHLVETQGTLADGDWANELHPEPDGFKKIAQLFLNALSKPSRFKGRV